MTGIVTDPAAPFLAGEVGLRLASRIDARFPSLRPAILSRQRFVDEWTTSRVREGGKTIFTLFGGVDIRSSRLPVVEEMGARILEIDSKAMLLLKLHRLHALLGATPPFTTFLESRSGQGLPLRSIQKIPGLATRPAVFVLEGLLPTLDSQTVERMLIDVSSVRVARKALLFDYLDEAEYGDRSPGQDFATAYLGVAPRFFMGRERVAKALEKLGFKKIHDRDLTEIAGYYGHAAEELQGVRIVTAEAISGT